MARLHLLEKKTNSESQFIKRVLSQILRSPWFSVPRARLLGYIYVGDTVEHTSRFVGTLLLFIDQLEGQESWLCCFSHLANQNLCYA